MVSRDPKRYDACVVGGAGHVGAPLALVLADKGLRTLVYDVNRMATEALASGVMPFMEEGGEPLLRSILKVNMIGFTDRPADIAGIPLIMITIATPIDEFHNPRLEVITRCIDTLMPYLSENQTIILRSTVYPGVTNHVHRYLWSRGKRLGVAFCPERVVQGKAIEEMQTLPAIVSGTTPEAEHVAAQVFSLFAPKIVRMEPLEAEFAKLISNAWRYIQFAAANEFFMTVENAGLDYRRVLAGAKEDYPRLSHLPGPGFAAGPCLMKDTMQLAAFGNNEFLLGSMAIKVNEGLPKFIVDRLSRRHDLSGKRVGILGMAFKANIDDTRESLSYKLAKILRFHGATVLCSDEYAKDPAFVTKEELVASSEIIIVGVPHDAYRMLAVPRGVEVVDLWGVLQMDGPPD